MTFTKYQKQSAMTAIYPKKIGLFYTVLGLAGEAGEIANKVKKILRDNKGKLTPLVKEQLRDECGDCLWYLAALSREIGIDLDKIAEDNLKKLQDRKERGVLSGSGDNR